MRSIAGGLQQALLHPFRPLDARVIHRHQVERYPELCRHWGQQLVVADDHPDVAGQLAGPVPDQQVVQAVLLAGYEDGDLPKRGPVAHGPVKPQPDAELVHGRGERFDPVGADLEPDALEEDARAGIVVLVRFQDVRVVLVQRACHTRHEAGPVGRADEQRQHMVPGGRVGGGLRVDTV